MTTGELRERLDNSPTPYNNASAEYRALAVAAIAFVEELQAKLEAIGMCRKGFNHYCGNCGGNFGHEKDRR